MFSCHKGREGQFPDIPKEDKRVLFTEELKREDNLPLSGPKRLPWMELRGIS